MHKSVPSLHRRELVQNQTGSQQVILRVVRVFDHSRQRLFQEIVIWRRLSHPNVLPVLGVSPQLFPLCIVTEWTINGNIMDFTSKHPEVNRLRLVRSIYIFPQPEILKYPEASRSGDRIAVSTFDANRAQRPQTRTRHHQFPLTIADNLHRQMSSLTAISILASPTTDSPPSYRIQTLLIPITRHPYLLEPSDTWHRNCWTPPASA